MKFGGGYKMAWAGTLTYGSTTTNIWNGTSGIQMKDSYLPQSGPDFSETGTVTEDIEFVITGSTQADIEVHMRELNTAFMSARLRQERNAGDRVYINLTPDGYSAAWRSEILDAIIQPSAITGPWGRKVCFVSGSWTRRNWWEGPQADVPLTNENGTDNTAGLRVYFCNDAGTVHTTYKRNNYATIDGAGDISGDLPGYGILSFTLTAPSTPPTEIYTQIGFTSDVEDAHWFDKSGTSEATASGGYYVEGTTGGTNYFLFENDYTGALYRVIARMKLETGSGTLKSYTRYMGVSGEERTPVIYSAYTNAFSVVNFGIASMGNYSVNAGGDESGYIYFETNSATNVDFDFIQVAGAQVVRDYFITTSYTGMVITDDTTIDSIYATFAVASVIYRTPITPTGSNKILVYPGKEQRIYFLSNNWARDNYATVTLDYRPRRSTL
jgi:hypothetical protein